MNGAIPRRFHRAIHADVVTSSGRIKVLAAIYQQLTRHPAGRTYQQLAAGAYRSDTPTAAQLAAVRRAAGKLVYHGLAERRRDESGHTIVTPTPETVLR